MKKIIISFLLLLTSYVYGAASDSITLSSNIDPVCSVDFTPEAIASNLDITTSASHLPITKLDFYSNTEGSTVYTSNMDLDLGGTLTHSNTVNQFNFDSLEYENITNSASGTAAFGNHSGTNTTPHEEVNLFISYTGIPALSLVQGTYSAQWFIGCSVEPL